MSFADLKKQRAESFDLIASKFAANTASEGSKGADERIWKPTADKAGNGSAVIRFLPPTENAPNGLPWVKLFTHGFQGPTGSYLIEPCPTTLEKPCPICEANRKLWNSGVDSDKGIASERKRKINYYSNIYVIKDPANEDNNGKVFLYRYGKKIFDMLNEQMNPAFEDIARVNPFDLWEGANFRLRFKKEAGYRTYDPSNFDNPSALSDDDKVLESVFNKMHELGEFVDPSQFKSFEELAERLQAVTTGFTPTRRAPEQETEAEMSSDDQPAWEGKDEMKSTKSEQDDDFDAFFSELDK